MNKKKKKRNYSRTIAKLISKIKGLIMLIYIIELLLITHHRHTHTKYTKSILNE